MQKTPFVVDIDDTLIYSDKIQCECCGRIKYKMRSKNQKEIDKLNELFKAGYTIILWTGRNWDCYEQTINQLVDAGIHYDQLVMGKPQGIYVDSLAITELPEP